MKNQMNLKEMGVSSLTQNELQDKNGGWTIFNFKITGVLDGIPDNTHCTLFGFKIW